MKGLTVGALILGLVAGLFSLSQVAAQEATITISNATITVGSSGTVELASANIGEPGLAAWSVDIFYDPSVVTATDCAPLNGSVCNPNVASNTVRVSGASATGFEGGTPLATVTFRCLTEGSTPLTIGIHDFADGTLGRPQPIDPAIANGSIRCEAVAQPATATPVPATPVPATPVPVIIVDAGTGPGDFGINNSSLIIAGLIGAGIAWLLVGVGGAGLTTVTAGALPWRRSPELGNSTTDAPTHETQTETVEGTDDSVIPTFRRLRRRDQ